MICLAAPHAVALRNGTVVILIWLNLFVPSFDTWQFSKITGWIRQLLAFIHLRRRMMLCGTTVIIHSGNGYISTGILPALPANLIWTTHPKWIKLFLGWENIKADTWYFPGRFQYLQRLLLPRLAKCLRLARSSYRSGNFWTPPGASRVKV